MATEKGMVHVAKRGFPGKQSTQTKAESGQQEFGRGLCSPEKGGGGSGYRERLCLLRNQRQPGSIDGFPIMD